MRSPWPEGFTSSNSPPPSDTRYAAARGLSASIVFTSRGLTARGMGWIPAAQHYKLLRLAPTLAPTTSLHQPEAARSKMASVPLITLLISACSDSAWFSLTQHFGVPRGHHPSRHLL